MKERGIILNVQGVFGLSNPQRSHTSTEMIARGGHNAVGSVTYQRGKLSFNAASRGVEHWKA
jgi:hypothetical protein